MDMYVYIYIYICICMKTPSCQVGGLSAALHKKVGDITLCFSDARLDEETQALLFKSLTYLQRVPCPDSVSIDTFSISKETFSVSRGQHTDVFGQHRSA